jgi:hypothetical protein
MTLRTRFWLVLITAVLWAMVLSACAAPGDSSRVTGTDYWCTARAPAPSGRCTAWLIGPSREQADAYNQAHPEQRTAPAAAPVTTRGRP